MTQHNLINNVNLTTLIHLQAYNYSAIKINSNNNPLIKDNMM